MKATARVLVIALLASVISVPAGAQVASASASPGPAIGQDAAALRAPVAVGVERDLSTELAQQSQRSFGRAESLMIIGGAAFLAGAIIGGDAGTIVMIGGAAIGLWGLYLYLQ